MGALLLLEQDQSSFHAGNRAGIEKQNRPPRFSTRPQIEEKDFPRQHIHQTQSVGEGRFWIWGRVCSAVGYPYLQDGGGVGNTLRCPFSFVYLSASK